MRRESSRLNEAFTKARLGKKHQLEAMQDMDREEKAEAGC